MRFLGRGKLLYAGPRSYAAVKLREIRREVARCRRGNRVLIEFRVRRYRQSFTWSV